MDEKCLEVLNGQFCGRAFFRVVYVLYTPVKCCPGVDAETTFSDYASVNPGLGSAACVINSTLLLQFFLPVCRIPENNLSGL